MTESEFLALAEQTLDRIEQALSRAAESIEGELDLDRQGNVLTITVDDGSQIVVNSHAANQEIWMAARSGGFHYRWDGSAWTDTRGGGELWSSLEAALSAQAGETIHLPRT